MVAVVASVPVTPQADADNYFVVGAPGSPADLYDIPSLVGPSGFGSGGEFTADSGDGDLFGFLGILQSDMLVPSGYVSGDLLDGSATYLNQSFDSMGLVGGTYTWTWETASGGVDYLTLEVVVPAPGALALFAVVGLAGARNRRVRSVE